MFSAVVKGYGYAVQVMKVEREKVSKQMESLSEMLESFVQANNRS